MLVIRNELYVPSMEHDLMQPFIMRSGGFTVNDTPEIHCEDTIVDDHSVSFDQSDLRISLRLNIVFSYFHTRVPTEIELHECEKLILNPDSSDWNPHCQPYEIN